MRLRVLASVSLLTWVLAGSAVAQTTPTSTLTGKVVDPEGLVLPGVTVTVASPALQGSRQTVTSANGDYIVPFLPAGDYTVKFELEGFRPLEQGVRVQVAETVPLNVRLVLGGLSESVTVTARPTTLNDFTNTATSAASYRADLIDKLPVSRTLEGAVLLAPGTTANGPRAGGITFSGAMSYEGLFLLNGVVLNETLRNQARELYIEDAIEEVKTSTGTISAEYGRFSGGVANTITKSGGNAFSGSIRVTLRNDRWGALTPFETQNLAGDPRVDDLLPTYEATAGGPILKNRLWFFAAGRWQDTTTSNTTRYTNIPFVTRETDRRYEAKGTWTMTPRHTVKTAYTAKDLTSRDGYFASATIMDLASLIDSETPESLVAANYSGILRNNFFVEAQYSRRALSFVGSGSRFTDIQKGTIIFDLSRASSRWNSPTFCAVCNAPEGKLNEEVRNNQNVVVKASYYWSTRNRGAHTIVFGADAYEDRRKNDNWQSGSGFRLYANNTVFRGSGTDTQLFPVVNPGATPTSSAAAYIMWNPIFSPSVGSRLRTYSTFFNDSWRVNDHWTFNIGIRYDKSDARDQAGTRVADDDAWSPRLAATFDPKGDGVWTFNGGFARYTMGATSNIVDLGSGAGRQSTFRYVYMGPAINQNPNAADLVPASAALATVFDWFFANGGTNRPLRDNPTYAGVNRRVGEDLITPSTYEYSAGVTRSLGSKGLVRVDGIFRNYGDFYAQKTDLSTGRVSDPRGTPFDLGVIVNTNGVQRTYKALQGQIQYRFTPDLNVGGNYTLSQARGNFNGETDSDGPVSADNLLYPEYRREDWNYPVGDLAIDQRHKVRLWVNYALRLGEAGRVDLGLLQNVTSGRPGSSAATVTVGTYVPNPGYLTPPATATYFFNGRGDIRTDAVKSTDLSVNYVLPMAILGPKSEFFVRFVIDNLFNQATIDGPNETIDTNRTDATLQAFNPFTTTPVEGVHYRKGPLFGQAISAAGYQTPRTFHVSGGFRF